MVSAARSDRGLFYFAIQYRLMSLSEALSYRWWP